MRTLNSDLCIKLYRINDMPATGQQGVVEFSVIQNIMKRYIFGRTIRNIQVWLNFLIYGFIYDHD